MLHVVIIQASQSMGAQVTNAQVDPPCVLYMIPDVRPKVEIYYCKGGKSSPPFIPHHSTSAAAAAGQSIASRNILSTSSRWTA